MSFKRSIQYFALCMIGSLTVVASAGAQNAQVRQGFWISGGLGYGVLGCENCPDTEGGASGNLSLGGTISPRFLLGVGTAGWTKSDAGETLSVGLLDARVRFYPSKRGGFFLTGGMGIGSAKSTIAGFDSQTETGVGMILGLGYDMRVSRNASITPYWNGFAMRNDFIDANVGQLGLAVTLH